MPARNGLFVEYCAKDFLDGTQILGPWEELAYRRICDFIYATNDSLPDNDRKLAWMTKTGNRWKRIKETLLEAGKIRIENGLITNTRCQKTLEKSARNIAQKSIAGKSSFASGKSLKNLERARTAVVQAVATAATTARTTNQEPLDSVPNGTDAEAIIPSARKTVFDYGTAILIRAGEKPPQARSLVAKWLKAVDRDDAKLMAILANADREPKQDIKAYIAKAVANGHAAENGPLLPNTPAWYKKYGHPAGWPIS